MVFRCPNIQAHCNEAVIYLNFGTSKNNEFFIWNKWKIYYFLVSQYLRTLRYVSFDMENVIQSNSETFQYGNFLSIFRLRSPNLMHLKKPMPS